MQNEHKTKATFSRLLRRPAWKWSGAILTEKDTGEVNKKGKYKQEKKEASYKKQKEASKKRNTHINNVYSA